jgi:hypothetical protein
MFDDLCCGSFVYLLACLFRVFAFVVVIVCLFVFVAMDGFPPVPELCVRPLYIWFIKFVWCWLLTLFICCYLVKFICYFVYLLLSSGLSAMPTPHGGGSLRPEVASALAFLGLCFF